MDREYVRNSLTLHTPYPAPRPTTLSLLPCRETLEPQEPPKLDEPTPDEREMKLVELTHRKWGGGLGQKAREDSDDVVVCGDRGGHRKRER